MTADQLAQIEARIESCRTAPTDTEFHYRRGIVAMEDAPVLVAEVKRLTKERDEAVAGWSIPRMIDAYTVFVGPDADAYVSDHRVKSVARRVRLVFEEPQS